MVRDSLYQSLHLMGSLSIPIVQNNKLGKATSISKFGGTVQCLFDSFNLLVLRTDLSVVLIYSRCTESWPYVLFVCQKHEL